MPFTLIDLAAGFIFGTGLGVLAGLALVGSVYLVVRSIRK